MARRFDTSGSARGAKFAVSSFGVNSYPSLAVANDSAFVVVWESYGADRNGGIDLFARVLSPAGEAREREFQIETPGSARYPAVAGDPFGGFTVVWAGRKLTAQRFTRDTRCADGNGSTTAADVNESVSEDATLEKRAQLALDELHDDASAGLGAREKRLALGADRAVEDGLFRRAPDVLRRLAPPFWHRRHSDRVSEASAARPCRRWHGFDAARPTVTRSPRPASVRDRNQQVAAEVAEELDDDLALVEAPDAGLAHETIVVARPATTGCNVKSATAW